MQNNEHKIDDLFREKLSGFQAPPPPEVWDRVAESMGHKRRKRRAILIWSFSGAASILLAFLLGWQLSNSVMSDQELYARLDEIKHDRGHNVVLESKIEQHIGLIVTHQQINTTIVAGFEERRPHASTRKVHDAMPLLASNIGILPDQSILYPELVTTSEEFLSEADRAIIEANSLALNQTVETDKGAWSVGVQGSPVFRFEDMAMEGANYDFATDAVQNQVAYSYKPNVSAGVSVAYEASSRVSIISGLNYADVSQSSGGVALSNAGHNWVLDQAEVANAEDRYYGESLTNTSATNNVILNTQIGLANVVLPEGTSLASVKNMNALLPEVAQNFDYDQHARYIEVPMLMRYKLVDKRLGIHLLGGINTNVLVDNSVLIGNESELVARGQIEGLRTLTWSSSLGMGLNFELFDRVQLSLEPTLKVQLNSLNSQQYINARPYTVGVFSGISYSF